MSKIKIDKSVSPEKLQELGVKQWPIWEKEESSFPWSYDEDEVCYILEGKVVVTPDGDDPVEIEKGDLVTFPKGMSCTWDIQKKIRKHYNLG